MSVFKRFALLLLLPMIWNAPAYASNKMADIAAMDDPHAIIKATTEEVMVVITQAQGYFDEDPDRFYEEIRTTLNQIVDFRSFARGVMGKYASSARYKALPTQEAKDELKAQVYRFTEVFESGLVQTYAKGLLAFNGNKIEVLPADAKFAGKDGSVTVVQHIFNEGDKPYIVHYKMKKNRDGAWKMRNVTIEAINLGKVYQSQFYSAVKQYNGDINKVIDNWTVDPTSETEDQSKAG